MSKKQTLTILQPESIEVQNSPLQQQTYNKVKTQDYKTWGEREFRVWKFALLWLFWKKYGVYIWFHLGACTSVYPIIPLIHLSKEGKYATFYTMNIFWQDWNLASLVLHSWWSPHSPAVKFSTWLLLLFLLLVFIVYMSWSLYQS